MTRINVVPVEELCNSHLYAEFHELTRIPNQIVSGKMKTFYRDAPTEYTLGKGHCLFFVHHLSYLKKRYDQLYDELVKRGYSVTKIFPEVLPKYASTLDYEPTEKALALNRARIQERMPKNARWNKVKQGNTDQSSRS